MPDTTPDDQTAKLKPGEAGHREAVKRFGAEVVARGTQARAEGTRAGDQDARDALRREARA